MCYNIGSSAKREWETPLFNIEWGGIMEIVNEITKLIKSKIEDAGYIIDNVVYEKEEKINFLRIIIDKAGAIDVDDCVVVSKMINPLLDEADLIKESYILDVCSKEKGSE